MRIRVLEQPLRHLGRLVKNEQLILTILAALIGLAGGACAIAFREIISLAQTVALGFGSEAVYLRDEALPWWRILLATVGGGLVIGLLVQFVIPGRRLHSVAEVIEASNLRQGRINLRAGLVSAFTSAVALGFGASTGREGPVVHFGATVAAFAAETLKLGRSLAHTLLGCGVAAAVAASFNAPIAGVFFALEVVIGHYALKAFAPIVIASVCGTIVSRNYFGDFPAFILPPKEIVSFFEFPAFALLGLVSAVMAIVFMRSVAFTQEVVARTKIPLWAQPACGGLLVGIIALASPHVLGVGYEATNHALHDRYDLVILISLLVAKTAATVICLGFNFGSGVFSPSLFLGAMLGGAFGVIATNAFPDLSSGYGAYTIVGMGAVAGAVLGAPISTILMVFELTNDYQITIAMMIGTAVASLVTQQAFGHSFFTWQLAGRGLDLKSGRSQNLLRSLMVAQVMKTDFEAVAPSAVMIEVREALQRAHYGEVFVVDGDGRLHGTITLADLSDAAFDTQLDAVINAEDVARGDPTVLTPEDTLDTANTVMESSGEEHIPVVRDRRNRIVVGFVHQLDVVTAYNRAVLDAQAEGQSAS